MKAEVEENAKGDDLHPKSAYPPKGTPMVWQRPKGQVKGILLYLNGCGGYATDMFTPTGSDGFEFDACQKGGEWGTCNATKPFLMTRQKARDRGYLVAAVQGGKFMNGRRCTNHGDVPYIQASLKFLRNQENLQGVKVMVMGFSSGGRTVPELAKLLGGSASCSVVVGNEVRKIGETNAELMIPTGYPKKTPIMFVYMPHDDKRINEIRTNIHQFRVNNIKTGEIQVGWGPKHHMAAGAYMDEIIDWCETGKEPQKSNPNPPANYIEA